MQTVASSSENASAPVTLPHIGPGVDRDPKTGRYLPGNESALKHGVRRYELSGQCPPEVATQVARAYEQICADKGGEDKSVLVKIRLRGRPTVVIETVSHDVCIAINIAAKRCKRAVRRSLKQSRQISHTGLRNIPA